MTTSSLFSKVIAIREVPRKYNRVTYVLLHNFHTAESIVTLRTIDRKFLYIYDNNHKRFVYAPPDKHQFDVEHFVDEIANNSHQQSDDVDVARDMLLSPTETIT